MLLTCQADLIVGTQKMTVAQDMLSKLEISQHSFHDLTHRSGRSAANSRFQRITRKVGLEKKNGEKFNKH